MIVIVTKEDGRYSIYCNEGRKVFLGYADTVIIEYASLDVVSNSVGDSVRVSGELLESDSKDFSVQVVSSPLSSNYDDVSTLNVGGLWGITDKDGRMVTKSKLVRLDEDLTEIVKV